MEQEKFSFIKRVKSFSFASRGIWIFLRTTHNAWLQIIILISAIVLGCYVGITRMEWIMLVLVSGFVFAAEAFNTAIEIDMNLTSPESHPYAKDTKDVAAGAVLISAITALIVGVMIFGPYLIS